MMTHATGASLAALIAAVLAGSLIEATPSAAGVVKTATASQTMRVSRYHPGAPSSARVGYALALGIDELSVKLAESGQLVRFSYRVIDPEKAKPMHDKAATANLLDEKMHAVLQVPVMEKVGPLRQTTVPEFGKSYWMAFSNKGNIVQAGHRVSVVIGQLRVDGLVVR